MPISASFDNALTSQTTALDTQASRLLRQTSASSSAQTSAKDDAKITKAGKDFESILLGSWLQQAENTFATVPGGDEDDDGSSGKDQFQGIAMQALAGSISKTGGIGIAKMISDHLHASASSTKVPPDSPEIRPLQPARQKS